MPYNQKSYVLEKEGVYFSFPSAKAACFFMGMHCSCLTRYANQARRYKGYRIIKAISEEELYRNKRLKKIWSSMHARCEYKKHPHFANYGGRGVKVCKEWSEYLSFAKWAFQNGYENNLTIDRIDNNGDYTPLNCRWVSMQQQQNNKRNNRMITYEDQTYTLTELARKTDIKKNTLKERLNRGWSINDAVNKPIQNKHKQHQS